MATQFTDPVIFSGGVQISAGTTFGLPALCVGNTQMNPSDPVAALKMEHRFMPRMSQPFGTAAVAERKVVHRARAAGTVTAYWVGSTAANVGAATVTVDLLKNGVTVLVSPVVLTSANAAFVAVAATLAAGAAYAAGDVLEVSETVAAGGGTLAQGVFGEPVLTEGA